MTTPAAPDGTPAVPVVADPVYVDTTTTGIDPTTAPLSSGADLTTSTKSFGSPAPHSQAWIVSALAIVGTVVLIALGKAVPDILYTIDGATITGAAALSFSKN